MAALDGITLPAGECLLFKKIFSMEFKCTTVSDACIYTHTINSWCNIYVDDLIIECTDLDTINTVKLQVTERYKVKDMG